MPPLDAKIYRNRFGMHCIRPAVSRTPCAREVMRGRVWEPNTIRFLRNHIGAGSIVHAGTSYGDFLPALSPAAQEGCRIWAFESDPENYRCACVGIILNDLNNVVLTHAALGDEMRDACPIQVESPDGVPLGGWSRVAWEEGDSGKFQMKARYKHATVPMVTIDEIVPDDEGVSLIQLDIEGSEARALRGASGTILRCQPIIVCEGPKKKHGTDDVLMGMGYGRVRRIENNNVYFPRQT